MTELIWEGKYDTNGRKVAPVKITLPFQTVETVNESVQERQTALDLFSEGRETEWRNRLIWGDKKYVLPSLLAEFAGKVNLIYIDPPFDTGANFSFTTTLPADEDDSNEMSFVKEASVIEQKAYRDTWGTGLDGYLKWFYETAVILRDLLSEDGSIYVQLDYHVAHYAKCVLDEVFGIDNFLNEIIWQRTFAHSDAKRFGMVHDVLFFYAKASDYKFNKQFRPHSESYIKSHYGQIDENGRRYRLVTATGAGSGPARKFGDKWLEPPKGRHWAYTQAKIQYLRQNGRVSLVLTGGICLLV